MGYKYEKRSDGILIRDVRVVKPIARNGRQELAAHNRDLDEGFMREAVARFNAETAKGKLYPLTLNHRGKRIGRILKQGVVSHDGKPTVTEDVLLTDPETQARWLRGELPEISADVDLENPEIFATSLLETGEGHFGHGTIGQVYPADLQVALEADGHKLSHVLCLQAEKETDMTPEELKAVLAENNKTLLAEVDKKLAPVLELKKANTDPLDPANDIIKERERATVLLKDSEEKQKLELARVKDIEQKVGEAMTADVGLNASAYRAQLEKRDAQARDDYHRLCLERARTGRQTLQTSDDPALKGKNALELQLVKEFREEKAGWEKLGWTEERWVEHMLPKRQSRIAV